MLTKELLDILACPVCKKPIKLSNNELICDNCRKAYPIKDDIPIMLPEKARDLNKNEV